MKMKQKVKQIEFKRIFLLYIEHPALNYSTWMGGCSEWINLISSGFLTGHGDVLDWMKELVIQKSEEYVMMA